MKTKLILIAALSLLTPGLWGAWQTMNELEVPADLEAPLLYGWDDFEFAVSETPATVGLVDDPAGVLPGKVYEILPGTALGSFFNTQIPLPDGGSPETGVWTFYFRWMKATGGPAEIQTLDGRFNPDYLFGPENWGPNSFVPQDQGLSFHNWPRLNSLDINTDGNWITFQWDGTDAVFQRDLWYEQWIVVDMDELTHTYYIRGGEWSQPVDMFGSQLWRNINHTGPFKAYECRTYPGTFFSEVEEIWGFAEHYLDAFWVDYAGENLETPDGVDVRTGLGFNFGDVHIGDDFTGTYDDWTYLARFDDTGEDPLSGFTSGLTWGGHVKNDSPDAFGGHGTRTNLPSHSAIQILDSQAEAGAYIYTTFDPIDLSGSKNLVGRLAIFQSPGGVELALLIWDGTAWYRSETGTAPLLNWSSAGELDVVVDINLDTTTWTTMTNTSDMDELDVGGDLDIADGAVGTPDLSSIQGMGAIIVEEGAFGALAFAGIYIIEGRATTGETWACQSWTLRCSVG